jgi:hypothetical protein
LISPGTALSSPPRRACSPASKSAICSPLDAPQPAEQACGLRVSILGRLELEDPVARAQLEIESQRAEQVLEGLIDRLVAAKVAKAACDIRIV